jgi:hypothetical protein
VENTIFKIDWLHCVDQGICSDFLASLFKYLLPKYPGANLEARLASLWAAMQQYYHDHPEVDSKLDNLTLSMLGTNKTGYKLRSRAGEARGLVNFAKQVAEQHLSDNIPLEAAVKQATLHLWQCYQNLSGASFSHAAMKEHCKKFCLMLAALESRAPGALFRYKPKVHLFQELCEMTDANPSLTWLYKDEDTGGALQALGRRRGGANTPKAMAYTTLTRFCISYTVPFLA